LADSGSPLLHEYVSNYRQKSPSALTGIDVRLWIRWLSWRSAASDCGEADRRLIPVCAKISWRAARFCRMKCVYPRVSGLPCCWGPTV